MTSPRWYQTTWSRVHAISMALFSILGWIFIAGANVASGPRSTQLLAVGLLLQVIHLDWRLGRLEKRS